MHYGKIAVLIPIPPVSCLLSALLQHPLCVMSYFRQLLVFECTGGGENMVIRVREELWE